MSVQMLRKPGVTRGNLWQTSHRWTLTNQKIEENAGERERERVSSALWQSHYLLSGLQLHSCCSCLSCNPVSIFHYRFIYMPEQMRVCWASDCRAGPAKLLGTAATDCFLNAKIYFSL